MFAQSTIRAAAGVLRLSALVVSLAVLMYVRPASAEIGAYLLFDKDTGEVIAQHKASALWYPASVTKLMTAHVTLQAVKDGELTMRSPVTISPQASQQPPSKMGFRIGTVITIETALRIIMTKSANDVSVALAEAVGGTQADFMARMNATATTLGMVNTFYDNPHGLPNSLQVTTARDTALLMMDLITRFPDRVDFFSMSGVRLGKRTLRNHNKLIRRFPGATGMKTGFICASGFNIAASAKRDGVHLGAVVFGGITSRERDERTAELLSKGFKAAANGGIVRLDGFGDLEDRLAVETVEGVRPAMGQVPQLPVATPDAEVTDLRPVVCGRSRPPTRYNQGTVTTIAEVEAERAEYAAWQFAIAERDVATAAALRPTRGNLSKNETATGAPVIAAATTSEPPEEFRRALADGELRNASFAPAIVWARVPAPRPGLRQVDPGVALVVAEFAPDDWPPRRKGPVRNPLEAAGLRSAPPAKPARLPLTYLKGARSIAPVQIAIGGAEGARPAPLSGPLVGGGRAPAPRAKPVLSARAETPSQEAL